MNNDYARIEPIAHAIKASRQLARRHYGIHPYFTRRPPNVVRAYIEHYSRRGDRVLDPFGGSGVTAIEAFLSNRHGIHNDINPLANFIAREISDATHSSTHYIREAFAAVSAECRHLLRSIPRMTDHEVDGYLRNVPLPANIELPRNADVRRFYDLFATRELLALGILKQSIDKLAVQEARGQLLLAWSATVAKLNKTFLSARGRAESRGGSSVFSIYRYKVAKDPVVLLPWETFEERVRNIIKGKQEVLREIRFLQAPGPFCGKFECHDTDVLKLPDCIEPVDYVFTDPPYGGHIAYLDLSTIWNHWLGFSVSPVLRREEIIVGGELNKSEDEYLELLWKSIQTCFQLLKPGRWISVVFQHWNTRYFEAILEAAEEAGGELRSAVTQVGDTIWSMHKKKNLERVLMGEMILTFFKDGPSRRQKRTVNHMDIESLVDMVLPTVAGSNDSFHGELLFNRLIIEAWRRNALRSVRIQRDEFIRLLEDRGWHYDPKNHAWTRSPLERQKELW